MGNQQTKQNTGIKDWEKVDIDNGIEIYRNLKTNELAEKRIVTLDPELDIKKEVKVYKMRQNNNDALVRAFGTDELSKKASSFVSCAGGSKIFVFTEKMPHRLSELPQLTFPQTLLFLRESLRAYERLYKEYGAVDVTKDLIGLNYLGEVKSWLNTNWALNHRGHEYGNLKSKKLSELTRDQYLAYREQYLDEAEMIKNLISVIEQKCEDGRFPQAFKEEVISQSGSFKKLLLYLKDFVEYNHIYVPDRINYQELVQFKFPVRLEHQSNFGLQRAQSQTAITENMRQGNHQSSQQSFLNFLAGNGGSQQGGQFGMVQGQTQIDQPIPQPTQPQGYQPPQQTSYTQQPSRLPFIPQPIKESPAASDIGQVTFSQSTRNYNQQQYTPSQSAFNKSQTQEKPSTTYSTYQWSSNVDNLYTPSTLQKERQVPLVSGGGGYGQTRQNLGGSYTFGGILNNTSNNNLYQQSSSSGLERDAYSASKFHPSFGTFTNTTEANTNNNYTSFLSKYNTSGPASTNTTNPTSNTNGTLAIGSLSNTYQSPSTLGYTPSYEQNYNVAKNNTSKWGNPLSNTNAYVTETYSYSGTKPVLENQGFALNSNNKDFNLPAAFSFDGSGKQDFGAKFGSGYTGSGYSNTLTKYESELSSNLQDNGLKLEGKYTDAFGSLLSPSLREVQPNDPQPPRTSNTTETVITTTTQEKRQSSNISNSHVSNQPFNNVPTQKQQLSQTSSSANPLEALAKMVERASNEVSQSVLKAE